MIAAIASVRLDSQERHVRHLTLPVWLQVGSFIYYFIFLNEMSNEMSLLSCLFLNQNVGVQNSQKLQEQLPLLS